MKNDEYTERKLFNSKFKLYEKKNVRLIICQLLLKFKIIIVIYEYVFK